MEQAMMNRKSIRTYTGNKLSPKHKKLIKDYLNNPNNLVGILNNEIRINLVDIGEKLDGRLGAYGNIEGATSFLVVICKNTDDMLIDVGYVFEKMILYLQSIGLGTAWQGATFDREVFFESANLKSGELIPIISPVGVSAEAPIDMDYEKRNGKRADLDILYFNNDFKTPVSDKELIAKLQHVRFAPSAINGQPCRILFDSEGTAHFYIARHPKFKNNALPWDVQTIDMGVAICHYMLATGKREVFMDKPDITLPSNISGYVLSVK